jgi:hypothetical protein
LSTTNPTWHNLGSNLGRLGKKLWLISWATVQPWEKWRKWIWVPSIKDTRVHFIARHCRRSLHKIVTRFYFRYEVETNITSPGDIGEHVVLFHKVAYSGYDVTWRAFRHVIGVTVHKHYKIKFTH